MGYEFGRKTCFFSFATIPVEFIYGSPHAIAENLASSSTFSGKKSKPEGANLFLLRLVVLDRAGLHHFSRSGPFFAAKATHRRVVRRPWPCPCGHLRHRAALNEFCDTPFLTRACLLISFRPPLDLPNEIGSQGHPLASPLLGQVIGGISPLSARTATERPSESGTCLLLERDTTP